MIQIKSLLHCGNPVEYIFINLLTLSIKSIITKPNHNNH